MEIPQEIKQFAEDHYTNAEIKILAGSHVRGEATKTSDYDIVIIDQNISQSYRETYSYNSRIYEVFVHSFDSCLEWFDKDFSRRKPSLQNMVKEGVLISGNKNLLSELKSIATKQIEKGPKPFSKNEIDDLRYLITDFLDDLIGSQSHEEWIFIINELIPPVLKLDIVMRGHWISNGKRIPRCYKKINNVMYENLLIAFNSLFGGKSKKEFIEWAYNILNQYGGRLDEGYCRGKY